MQKITLLVMFAFFYESGNAYNCDWPKVSLEERVKRADIVFSGKFKKPLGKPKNAPEKSNQHALVTVSKMFKGPEAKSLEVFYFRRPKKPFLRADGFPNVNCSQNHFNGFDIERLRKDEFLFFGKLTSGKVYTSYELGTNSLTDQSAREDVEKLPSILSAAEKK